MDAGNDGKFLLRPAVGFAQVAHMMGQVMPE